MLQLGVKFLKNMCARSELFDTRDRRILSHRFLLFQENIRVLLDLAAEQPDREYLLQKHFTALLSTVWKARIRGNRLDSSLSWNGFYSGARYFSTGNHITRYFGRETTGKLRFGNTGHNFKLLAAALNDVCSTRMDDKKPQSYHGERASVTTEQLELTLEFQGENDLNVPFPSSVDLIVSDSVYLPLVNLDTCESSGARKRTKVAETRFRYDPFFIPLFQHLKLRNYDVYIS